MSTLFIEQLHLLVIVCLAMKGNDATTGIIVAVLHGVCIHLNFTIRVESAFVPE